MNKRIVAFGCSNTWGEGLPDKWDYEHKICTYDNGPSKFAWPQILANNLKRECLNLSEPGTSNKFITNRILNTKFEKDDIVVVVWTFYSRTCFFQDDGSHKRIMVQDILNNKIGKLKRNSKYRFEINYNRKWNKIYYRHFYTDVNANIDSHMNFNLVKFYLDKNNIKNYHFTCDHVQTNVPDFFSSSPIPIPSWSTVSPIEINDCYNDYALDCNHPGIESHKKIAEKIKKTLV